MKKEQQQIEQEEISDKKWKIEIVYVTSILDWVANLILRRLKRYSLEIIQIYVSTISHLDKEIERYKL